MKKLTKKLKGKDETVFGLAGLGDLHVSAAGGRNSMMGHYLGKGLLYKDAKENHIKETTVEVADLAFEIGPMEGLTAQEVKDYIRFIGNRRLVQLGLEPIYDVEKNPLTWLDTMLNAVEHMNFFEGRATEYSKASTKGTWGEVFA